MIVYAYHTVYINLIRNFAETASLAVESLLQEAAEALEVRQAVQEPKSSVSRHVWLLG